MIILTAANKKFKKIVELSIKNTIKLNYKPVIYDLGNLGYGKPYIVKSQTFQKDGFYCHINNTWKSKAIHKPQIIFDALLEYKKTIVYLDAGAVPYQHLNEIKEKDFDIGLTIRRESEFLNEPVEDHRFVMGKINAGVMFFKYTQQTIKFLSKWIRMSETHKNDQLALNIILNLDFQRNHLISYNELKILTVPTDIYNFYYFKEVCPSNVKIIHYKNDIWLKGQQYKDILL